MRGSLRLPGKTTVQPKSRKAKAREVLKHPHSWRPRARTLRPLRMSTDWELRFQFRVLVTDKLIGDFAWTRPPLSSLSSF